MQGGAATERPTNRFFANIWHGNVPLVRVYWLYFFLGNTLLIVAILFVFVTPLLSEKFELDILRMAAGALTAFLIYPVYSIFTAVGVIRSGRRYARLNRTQPWKQNCGRLAQGVGLVAGVLLPILLIAALILPAGR